MKLKRNSFKTDKRKWIFFFSHYIINLQFAMQEIVKASNLIAFFQKGFD